MVRSLRLASLATLLAAIALSSCGGSGGETTTKDGVTSVKFALSSRPSSPAFTYFSALPIQLGYWEEEGLDVELISFEGGAGQSLAALGAGEVLAVDTATSGVISAAESGVGDVIAVFTNTSKNVYYPVVPADSKMQTLADYAGKRVGIQSLEAAAPIILRGAMIAEGVDPNSVEFIPVGVGPEVVVAFKSGKIDTYQGADVLYTVIEAAGIKLRRLPSETIDNSGFLSAMVTSREAIDENRDALVGLARGIAKSMVFAQENPEAAVKLFWKQYPDTKPAGMSEEDALAQGVTNLQARMASVGAVDGLYGNSTEAQVDSMIDILATAGVVKDPPEVDRVWTNEIVADANDFDLEKIRQFARNYSM